MIKIIETTTAERKQETITLFEKIKPLLDKGCNFRKAVMKVTGKKVVNTNQSWYNDLTEYAKTQGYNYRDYW